MCCWSVETKRSRRYCTPWWNGLLCCPFCTTSAKYTTYWTDQTPSLAHMVMDKPRQLSIEIPAQNKHMKVVGEELVYRYYRGVCTSISHPLLTLMLLRLDGLVDEIGCQLSMWSDCPNNHVIKYRCGTWSDLDVSLASQFAHRYHQFYLRSNSPTAIDADLCERVCV